MLDRLAPWDWTPVIGVAIFSFPGIGCRQHSSESTPSGRAPAALASTVDSSASDGSEAMRGLREGGASSRCTGEAAGEQLSELVDSPWDVVAADLDGDRKVDLVVAQAPPSLRAPGAESAKGVRLLLNRGDSLRSGLWRCVQLEPVELTNRLVVGDIDGDGQLDVVGGTWQTREVRFWRLGPGAKVIASEKTKISLDDATRGAPPQCGHAEEADLVLSSLALGDLDANGRPHIAVTLYRRDQETQPCVNQPFFSFDAASNRLVATKDLQGPGMMRGRFADVDGDGRLDFAGSAYAVQCADGEHTTCGNRGVWGWWYRSVGRDRKRLETPVLADKPNWVPRLTAADFDIWPIALGKRTARLTGSTSFAVAMTGLDACNSADCWNAKTQGGYVAFVRADGKPIGSSAGAERTVEAARPDGALLSPEAVLFVDGAADGAFAASYQWVKYCDPSSCTSGGDSPLLFAGGAIGAYAGASSSAPTFASYPAAMHMLGLALLPKDSTADAQPTIDDEQQLDKRQHVVYLRSRNVVAIDRVWDSSDAERRPLRFSWYPGDAWITLLEATVPPSIHVAYRAIAERAIAAADSSFGIIIRD